MVSAGPADFSVLLAIQETLKIDGETRADHRQRRREVRWKELRRREPRRKVLSRGELEKNGFSTFERAHDILFKGVFKN